MLHTYTCSFSNRVLPSVTFIYQFLVAGLPSLWNKLNSKVFGALCNLIVLGFTLVVLWKVNLHLHLATGVEMSNSFEDFCVILWVVAFEVNSNQKCCCWAGHQPHPPLIHIHYSSCVCQGWTVVIAPRKLIASTSDFYEDHPIAKFQRNTHTHCTAHPPRGAMPMSEIFQIM